MDLWRRALHRGVDPGPPSPVELQRDPDLDTMHDEQHHLINRAQSIGLRQEIRDRWNERIRDSWRPTNHDPR